jgi:hypothetical protein
MAQTVEELSFNYEDDQGQLVRKQVDKRVLSKGAWATVMFKYQELDRQSGDYRAPKIAIVRFKKSNGVYRKQSSFNISSERQARQIVDTIEEWYGEEQQAAEAQAPPAPPAEAQAAQTPPPAAEPAPTAPASDSSTPTE